MIGLVNRTAPPCKGCQRRHAKCHGQCEDYAVYLQEVQIDKAKRYAAYSEGDFYSMNIARRESVKKAIKEIRRNCVEIISYELKERKTSHGEIFEASLSMKVKRDNRNEQLIEYLNEFDDVTISSVE